MTISNASLIDCPLQLPVTADQVQPPRLTLRSHPAILQRHNHQYSRMFIQNIAELLIHAPSIRA
ncbi:hypothetical protein ABW41_03525 [Stenotrophomonas maltophilia]|nr:hypothetical protein ABW41_03525 [Stenotrophomonas maltophilia]